MKLDPDDLEDIADSLDELYEALGLSVIVLNQTKKALKKDTVTLRVNAFQLRDSIRDLQRMQESLFVQLKNARVIGSAD